MLLLFRFRNLSKRPVRKDLSDTAIEPRLNQIFTPLLSIVSDPATQEEIREIARRYQRQIISDRGMDMEAEVLEIIVDLLQQTNDQSMITVKDVTSRFIDRFAEDYERRIRGN